MPSKLPPLPVKWYLASVAGALIMALALMGVFTALGGHQRTLAMTHAHVPSEEDQDRQIESVSPSSSNPLSAPSSARPNDEAAAHADPANSKPQPSHPDQSAQPKPMQPEPQPPKTDPTDSQNPDQPTPAPRPSLWSLLVSPEMVIGALSLVTLGTILQVRRAVLSKRSGV